MLTLVFTAGMADDMQDPLQRVYQALKQRDYVAACELLTREADKGNPKAQLILGKMYMDGKFLAMNRLRGLVLIRKAAEQQVPEAEYQLALAYRDGHGTSENPGESFKWCLRAADQSHEKALCLLGTMLKRGYGCQQDPGSALLRFEQAAKLGNAESMFQLGRMYENGEGTPQDEQKAKRYYRQAADAGHEQAKVSLIKISLARTDQDKAQDYFRQSENSFKAGEIQTALSQLEMAASLGYAPAQLKLGTFHLKNFLVNHPDPEKGVELIRKAAESGIAAAQYLTARLYYEGKEIKQDHRLSFEWCMKAADQNYPDALGLLGYFYRKGIGCTRDPAAALTPLHQGTEFGNAECLFQLAEMHRLGDGIEEDQTAAEHYYQQAAEKGHKTAGKYLNEFYSIQKGNSSPIRQMTSLDELRRLAERGDAESQYQMALAYREGKHTIQTPSSSFHWCRKAADQGHTKAQGLLGIMYRTGYGCRPDYRQAIQFFSLAAEKGDLESIFQQGEMYRLGLGMDKNPGIAAEMFKQAARKGYAEAAFRLAEMYRQGEGVPQNLNAAASYYQLAADKGHTGAIHWVSENRHLVSSGGSVKRGSFPGKRKNSRLAEESYQRALSYRDGRLGYSRNLKKYFEHCRIAAEHGHTEAQYQLGIMYRTGYACTRNYRLALKWISLAADQDHVESLYIKGIMYMLGEGIARPDLTNAAEIFKRAARKGHLKAQRELQHIQQSTLTE